MLRLPDPPTALFTGQNLVTIGASRALRALGLEDTVAMVGFDDFPLADMLRPGVTVVAQDVIGLGRLAAETLFRRLDGDRSPFRTHVLPTWLITRGSGEIGPLRRRDVTERHGAPRAHGRRRGTGRPRSRRPPRPVTRPRPEAARSTWRSGWPARPPHRPHGAARATTLSAACCGRMPLPRASTSPRAARGASRPPSRWSASTAAPGPATTSTPRAPRTGSGPMPNSRASRARPACCTWARSPPGPHRATVRVHAAAAALRRAGQRGGQLRPQRPPGPARRAGAARPLIERFASVAHIVKASREDIDWLYPGASLEQVSDRLLDLGALLVVITDGPRGAHLFRAGHSPVSCQGLKVKVADTIGAGDAFTAGLLGGLSRRGLLAPGDLLRWPSELLAETAGEAVLISALTCERVGADPPFARGGRSGDPPSAADPRRPGLLRRQSSPRPGAGPAKV